MILHLWRSFCVFLLIHVYFFSKHSDWWVNADLLMIIQMNYTWIFFDMFHKAQLYQRIRVFKSYRESLLKLQRFGCKLLEILWFIWRSLTLRRGIRVTVMTCANAESRFRWIRLIRFLDEEFASSQTKRMANNERTLDVSSTNSRRINVDLEESRCWQRYFQEANSKKMTREWQMNIGFSLNFIYTNLAWKTAESWRSNTWNNVWIKREAFMRNCRILKIQHMKWCVNKTRIIEFCKHEFRMRNCRILKIQHTK